MSVFVYTIVDRLSADSIAQYEKIILEQRLKSEINNLETLKNLYSNQRKLTHDFSNHISTINQLSKCNGDIERIIEYTDKLIGNISSHTMIVDTNNPTVDAVINQKYNKAQQLGVSMRFEIDDLNNFVLSSNDCVTILANALDNAIEASSKVFDKIVRVKILRDETSSIISIINTSNPVNIEDNSIIIDHNEDIKHGYGLNNIKTALSAYNHIFAIDYSSGWFQLTIILNND